jgi:hypothetical protein
MYKIPFPDEVPEERVSSHKHLELAGWLRVDKTIARQLVGSIHAACMSDDFLTNSESNIVVDDETDDFIQEIMA